ncbi:hypothetical protein [Paenibacillus chitinolyticus]|uniref:hypothetical protein n=1 Tax=Paenibacillus chitinolyticus TaxID=79263 RepID=UPI001C456D7D|nr:hypothetical protein [Paenibacillus chitinolyticus]MBV6717262.1 hypothetical protein [Paenibacillus chitinolyticus]
MSNRTERIYIFKIRDLLNSVPDVRNKADIKSISEFRHEMIFVREKLSWALYWLAEGIYNELDECLASAEEYLKERQHLWNEVSN